jgi:uncharacterized protein (TIGR03067 family)
MRSLAPLLLAAVSLAFAPAPFPKPPKPVKDDLTALQGPWQRLSYTFGGNPVTLVAPDGGSIHAVIKGNKLTYTQGTLVHGVWTFTPDRTVTPRRFTVVWKQGGTRLSGIYKVEGDTLTMQCGSKGEYPPTFDPNRPGYYFSVFKRAKPGTR